MSVWDEIRACQLKPSDLRKRQNQNPKLATIGRPDSNFCGCVCVGGVGGGGCYLELGNHLTWKKLEKYPIATPNRKVKMKSYEKD
jgi:hypothetical protein